MTINRVSFGKYEVTEYGEVYFKDKKIKPFFDKDGYLRIELSLNKKKKKYYVHRLVYMLFNGDLNDLLVCCHKDGDKINNHYLNIEQKTQKENIKDKAIHGTWQGGENHPKFKYSDQKVLDVRDLLKMSDWSLELIAKTLNVPKHFVFDVKRGKRKTAKERESEALS